jgi:mercuric ion transport protein
MAASTERYKTSFLAAAVGTAVVTLCCFTPILVIVLGIVGLTAVTPYLDYLLFPGLVVLLVVTVVSYQRWKRRKAVFEREASFMPSVATALLPQLAMARAGTAGRSGCINIPKEAEQRFSSTAFLCRLRATRTLIR